MIWHNFKRPTEAKFSDEEREPTYGRFVADPFERGWGNTAGNALRRALLASIPGAAITAVKVEGADHEFSAVPGVVEDVTDIILNLKRIPLKIHGHEPVFLTLDVHGPGEITAGDFQGPHNVDVIDPNVHVATLSADGHLQMSVRVAAGRGYIVAEENKTEDLDLGYIPVDSAHSPVLKASCKVEMARQGRKTNFERLVIEVWTNGTVMPEEALSQAAQLIQGHMEIYARLAAVEEMEQPVVVEEEPEEDSLIEQSIETLELSIRSMNCLKNANIRTLRDLVSRSEREMTDIRNFGEKSLKEVREKLESIGFGFGITQPEK